MLKFKPPNSILKTIQEKQNTNIINYETTQAANEMYNKDPVVKHNIENFTNTRTNGLLPKEKIHVDQPFEPIVGHTGLNVFPEQEADMFQRKMEMFTGGEKTKFFHQKEAVLNDPNLMVPDPILNTAVPNAENRIEFYKQNLLRQGNVKPFESKLVGARHIQPIFRPLPKVGGDKYVNPKKTLEYQTITPPRSNVEKGAIAAQTFKNKVETAFAMDRLGFTTEGAIVAPTQYGNNIMKEQNRSETASTGDNIFRNTSPFNSTPLQQQSPANFNVNTNKEDIQKKYIPNPNAFNSQTAQQKGAENYHVNTDKEDIQKKYIPNPNAFNSQTAQQKGAENYHVNTDKEQVMNTKRTGNGQPYNNVEAQSSGIGDIQLINKEDVLRGRMVNKKGPNITNVDINVGFNKRKQLETRGFLNGYVSTTERLQSIYNIKNKEIDITERLDPCLNIPLSNNPYQNSFL